jgi:hypothetical protein
VAASVSGRVAIADAGSAERTWPVSGPAGRSRQSWSVSDARGRWHARCACGGARCAPRVRLWRRLRRSSMRSRDRRDRGLLPHLHEPLHRGDRGEASMTHRIGISSGGNSRPRQSSDDPLGALHQAALRVEAERLGLGPLVRDDRADAMTANGSIAMCGDLVVAKYQATPPNSRASVKRSITESKNAPRWLEVLDALASAPSSRSGSAARMTSTSPRRSSPAPMRPPRRRPRAGPSREVVGRQAGAAEAVARAASRPVDRGRNFPSNMGPRPATPRDRGAEPRPAGLTRRPRSFWSRILSQIGTIRDQNDRRAAGAAGHSDQSSSGLASVRCSITRPSTASTSTRPR